LRNTAEAEMQFSKYLSRQQHGVKYRCFGRREVGPLSGRYKKPEAKDSNMGFLVSLFEPAKVGYLSVEDIAQKQNLLKTLKS
jgi:hypothetical protein